MAAPTRHGLPCLFPPNRIDEGRFTFDGRSYQFTMKQPNPKRLFSHGFLYTRPWQAVQVQENAVTMRFDCDSHTDFYPDFPHAFRMDVLYTLTEEGLLQNVCLEKPKFPIRCRWAWDGILPSSCPYLPMRRRILSECASLWDNVSCWMIARRQRERYVPWMRQNRNCVLMRDNRPCTRIWTITLRQNPFWSTENRFTVRY